MLSVAVKPWIDEGTAANVASVFTRQSVPEPLLLLASEQSEVLSREQVLGHGLTPSGLRRILREEQWQRMTPGVYYVHRSPPPWLAWCWGGVLVGGDHARVAGLAAAHLHGLRAEAPDTIEILVPMASARPLVEGPWAFARERPSARSPRALGAPPRVPLEDVVLDLIDRPDATEEEVVGWLTDAVGQRLTTERRLSEALAKRRAIKNRALVLDALGDVAHGARSPLEVRYLRDVERGHGLPEGARQRGRRGTQVDVWYEDYALLVELDGLRGHTGRGRHRDMLRDNSALLDGLGTLRFGYGDVFGRPCEVSWQVGRALTQRGWDDLPTRCRRCARVV